MATKKALATLFSMLNLFHPERTGTIWTGRFLVNQKKLAERQGDLKSLNIEGEPDRDDLLHLIGMASLEMTEFIKEHDALMNTEASHTQGILEINAALDNQMQPTDITEGMAVIEKIELILGRYRQMYDLIHHIAHNVPENRTKQLAIQFLQFKADKLALVNQNEKASQVDAGSGQPVCTCSANQQKAASLGMQAAALCLIHGTGVHSSSGSGEPLQSDKPDGANAVGSPQEFPFDGQTDKE